MAGFLRALLGLAPEEVPPAWLKTYDLNQDGGFSIEPNLPFLVIQNFDNVTHILSLTPRASGSGAGASPVVVPLIVASGDSVSVPTLPFATLGMGYSATTDVVGSGLVFAFYSDVPISSTAKTYGPGAAAGVGATVVPVNQAEETLATVSGPVKRQVCYFSLTLSPAVAPSATPAIKYIAIKGATSGTYYAVCLSTALAGSFMMPVTENLLIVARNADAADAVNVAGYAEMRNR